MARSCVPARKDKPGYPRETGPPWEQPSISPLAGSRHADQCPSVVMNAVGPLDNSKKRGSHLSGTGRAGPSSNQATGEPCHRSWGYCDTVVTVGPQPRDIGATPSGMRETGTEAGGPTPGMWRNR
jgi:hypothetical protein